MTVGGTKLALPVAAQPALRFEVAAEEETALNSQSLLLLALYMLSSYSEGGGELTAAEEELLASLSLGADIAPDQRDALLHNVAELAAGQADVAALATLETVLGTLREATAEFQGATAAIANELAVLDASLNTQRLPGVPARRHVARPLNYLLVDRETGFEIRGVTRPSGLGDAVWLGSERTFTVVYYDRAEDLAALTSFKTNPELSAQLVPPVLAGSLDSPDTDGDGLTDLSEWVLGSNPEAQTPREEWDTGSNTSGLLTQADTPGYAMDICAVTPKQLAVADVQEGLALLQVEGGNTLREWHREPQEMFGDDLVAVYCDPYHPGHLLAESLAGALFSISVGEDPTASALQEVQMISLPPQGEESENETEPVMPYWRSVAFSPDWMFLGDNRGQLQGIPVTSGAIPGDSPEVPPDPVPLLTLEYPIENLAFRLDTLYVLTSRALHTYLVLEEGNEPKLHPLGHAWVPGNPASGEWRRPLSVLGNRIHVGSQQGLTTLDATDPLELQVVSRPNFQHGMIRDLWPIGDSLLLALVQYAVTESPFLAVLDVSPRRMQAAPVWLLPGTGQLEHLTVIDGITYTASGTEGVTAWNALGVQTTASDLMPVLRTNRTPGSWEAGGNATFEASTTGKALLRRVELYQEGERLLTDTSAPFTFALAHGDIPNLVDPARFELVYVNGKGQTTEVHFTLETVADAQPPRLLSVTPTVRALELMAVANPNRTLTLHFSEPVALDIPDEPMVRLLYWDAFAPGPALFQEMSLDLELAKGATVIRVGLPEDLPAGEYLLTTHPELGDAAGNFLPQVWVGRYTLHTDVNASTLELQAIGMEDPTTWMTTAPVATGAGRTVTLTGAGGTSLHSLTAVPVGQSSLSARSDRMVLPASQVQQQAVQAVANASEADVDELFAAVDANDVEKVRQLLVAGADPNVRTLNNDQTPLHIAANGRGDGHVEIIRLLLAAGADPNVRTLNNGRTPLHNAASDAASRFEVWSSCCPSLQNAASSSGNGHVEIICLLLAAGADPYARTLDRAWTPLHIAANGGGDEHVEIIRLLLEYGVDPNGTLHDAWTPLHVAANGGGNGHVEIIRLLLAAGADPYARTLHDAWTPLHVAANGGGNGHVEIIRLLLAAGADPYARTLHGGWTPLHIAANGGGDGHVEIIRLLLEYGIDPNTRTLSDWTPLRFAIQRGQEAAIQLLLDYGARD
ncbi:MAG: ankyrin repeat domain-containing protein [Caldilineaceae bacterium]|nr:ankyrin repeat domain-containing protein [Caldilineaceae bacterium]